MTIRRPTAKAQRGACATRRQRLPINRPIGWPSGRAPRSSDSRYSRPPSHHRRTASPTVQGIIILQTLGPLFQRRPPMVVAQAVGAHLTAPVPLRPLLVHGAAGHGSSIIPAPAPLRAQLTAAGLQKTAQQAALQHPRLTTQLVAQRAATGVPTTLAAIEAAKMVHEAMQLMVLLPPYALATVCGTSVARLFESAPQQIVDHVLRRARRRWTSATIAGARRASSVFLSG